MGPPASRALGRRARRRVIEGANGPLTRPTFDQRISRAGHLAAAHAAAAEPLRFYARLTAAQHSVVTAHPHAFRRGAPFTDALDLVVVARALPRLLAEVVAAGPSPLESALRSPRLDDPARSLDALARCWSANADSQGDDPESFLLDALLQPFAEAIAARAEEQGRASRRQGDQRSPGGRCPVCGRQPVVALLREAGHGAKRSLVCGFCLTEWRTGRIECPSCAETRFEALPVFRADALSAVRIDICDSCRTYMKTIDLTEDATAIGVVDDIATLALDLWARGQGYRRLRPNLLRL